MISNSHDIRATELTKRFKLTVGFLIVSAVIFAAVAYMITRMVATNEENNLVEVISSQSSKDARVIAGVVTGLMADPVLGTDGAAFLSPTDSPGTQEHMAMSTFLRTSGIVRLSLFDASGALIWSSAGEAPAQMPGTDSAFVRAASGEMSSSLSRQVSYSELDGDSMVGDVVETYIPLLDPSTDQPAQVLEVERDVTADLRVRISSAKTSMFQTVFGSLGGAFVVLLGVVMTADVLIWRSGRKAIANERALTDEKVTAAKLELENQQLRDINQERDRFLSMISHELRTPLTSMMAFSDVLARGQDGEKKDRNLKHLQVIRRNGQHLNSLIEELLEITRIESGRFEVEKEGFDVADVVEEARQTVSALLKPRGQTLRVEMNAGAVELHGDRRRILQVMLNLISNASKYSPDGSQITLLIEKFGESIRISVQDQGQGIPPEDRKRLFERFYRRDDEVTRSQSGLGLGLSIVKAIADAHHGSVNLQSEVGTGTTVTVTVPGVRLRQATSVVASPSSVLEAARKRAALKTFGDLRGISPAPAAS